MIEINLLMNNPFYYLASSSLPLAMSHLGDSGMKYTKTGARIQGADTIYTMKQNSFHVVKVESDFSKHPSYHNPSHKLMKAFRSLR